MHLYFHPCVYKRRILWASECVRVYAGSICFKILMCKHTGNRLWVELGLPGCPAPRCPTAFWAGSYRASSSDEVRLCRFLDTFENASFSRRRFISFSVERARGTPTGCVPCVAAAPRPAYRGRLLFVCRPLCSFPNPW